MKTGSLLIISFIVLICASGIIGCKDILESDEDKIKSRIDDLQKAINNNSFSDFMSCFHPECDYSDTFNAADVTGIHDLGTYDFHGFTVDVSGSTAQVNCTASVTDVASSDHVTVFDFKKSSDEWLILKWTEDSVEVFRNIKLKK